MNKADLAIQLAERLNISKKLVSEVDKDGIKPQIFKTENLEELNIALSRLQTFKQLLDK